MENKKPMTEAELAELERVYLASTQGEYFVDLRESIGSVDTAEGDTVAQAMQLMGRDVDPTHQHRKNNAAAIAALHNAFPRLLATIRHERERCAKVALAERISGEIDTAQDEAYNQACEDIAARIRSGE